MMKRKEIVNLFKFLGVLCVFALGYMTIVGTSSDDLLPSRDENVTLLDEDVDENSPNILAFRGFCDDVSLEDLLGESTDNFNIDLNTAYAEFSPTNNNSGVTCAVVISGTTVAQVYLSGTTPERLTTSQINTTPIITALNNPATAYEYCASCDGASGTTFTVTVSAGANVTIGVNL